MYDHKQTEEKILKFWKENTIYKKLKKANIKGENFYFCDGPPYATGQIHPGTGWNKCAKDALCRYWRGMGYNVRAQPGFDTHGLPIEVKVEKEISVENKKAIEEYGIEKFIKKCKDFATRYIDVMSDQFQQLGVWMDWKKPYLTFRNSYIEASWKTIYMAHKKELLAEGVYVLPYCYRCETTMANYELEYGNKSDPSLFVKFKLKDKENEYLIIWTTTPWTLVANMGVMVHPNFYYVRAKVDDEVWIVAKELLDKVLEKTGKSGAVLEEFIGKKLSGLFYEHPFQDQIKKKYDRKVVLSDEFISLEEGTGLVHCAPGHGPEDFIIGKRFDIEAFCPVDGTGDYTEEAGIFKGENVLSANPDIIQLLKDNGSLLVNERIKHRYPHCWRCKTPLIFLTTKQWFITVSKLKDKMEAEISKTEWHPEFARNRFKDFVRDAPDWCISRQRYWGIPLPIWRCKNCEEIKVLEDASELGGIKDLHRPYIDKIELQCPSCKSVMKRVPDVLDVWFDSGNAVWAPLSEDELKLYDQADFIIEGQDQIRGWFYSLLGSGLVRNDKSPYKRVLMHGFFVDEKGEKMSKSVGNFVPLEEIIEKYGSDSFRLWGLSSTLWEEQKFNWTSLKEAHGTLDVLNNLTTYLLRFYPKKQLKEPSFSAEDKWLLSRLNSTIANYHKYFSSYEMNKAVKEVVSFLVEDLSQFYMKIAKGRISAKDQTPLYVIYYSVFSILKMLSPITPFLAEELYLSFFQKYEKKESIHLISLPIADESSRDLNLEKQMQIIREIAHNALTLRQEASVKLRWPLRELAIFSSSHEVKEAVNTFSGVLKRVLNIKQISFEEKSTFKSIDFTHGKIFLDTEIYEDLFEEAMFLEVKRRIQLLRKEAGLVEKDSIKVKIDTEDELKRIIEKSLEPLSASVNASKIEFKENKGKSWVVDGRKIVIKIKKV
ncbi:isoleucine--tRNA ligase [Candidatus Micrarchaeota archaeon]|nr:isoleucine--tRNA ligase [Candidatus Micrarchaeota archaeon]